MEGITDAEGGKRTGIDWRGWLALAWAIGWGWAYAMMVLHARAPHALAWLRSWMAEG
jgi:hypothetical protein